MKTTHYYTALGLGAACLVLSLTLLILGNSAHGLQADVQKLQTQLQTQQDQINAGVTIQQQVIPNLFTDLAKFPEDVAIKALIAKHSSSPAPIK